MEEQKFAYGALGLQPESYWALTPAEYWLMVQGYLDKVEGDREYLRSVIYGAARFNGAGVAGAFSKEASRAIQSTIFPWEKSQQQPNDIEGWIMSWKNRN